ncbi:MAG: 3-methyl-2-oxobutanoate hydroxymethyltransferase [Bacteroidetes bacterium]|nr:3-methyl-2-oxobutanoate hydroxymethyltransferase [Bacteroidota bacterium]
MSNTSEIRRVTTRRIIEMKKAKEKVAALTAYDFLIARLCDRAGIDLVLVGDSVGNVFQGHETTLPVTLDDMIYHTKAVQCGVKRAMIVVDMPFMSYQTNPDEAFRNAGRIMKETDAGAVKLEGGEIIAETVAKLTANGIPVLAHIGLTPQSIHRFGGYQPRGRDKEEAAQLIKDAKILEEAGAFAIVIEKIPALLAKKITQSVNVPTIGIGAGKYVDGQILVVYDMLGLLEEFNPRFVRKYLNLSQTINDAFTKYVKDTKSGEFPNEKESY